MQLIRGIKRGFAAAPFISLIVLFGTVFPSAVHASLLDTLSGKATTFGSFLKSMSQEKKAEALETAVPTLQTMPLPKAAMNIDPNPSKGGGDVTVVDDSALLPDEGPSGTIADIVVRPKNSTISIYVVRDGDTLSGIAELFDVSANTIMWANDLPKGSKLKVGQTLTILPVTGVKYTVKKGDTLASIAKAYHGDADEIANFNGLSGASLAVGTEIIIPDGEISAPAPKAVVRASTSASSPTYAGYYLRPVVGGTRTQGIHGYNGVDIAASVGTPILASATGDIIVAKGSGWNGGYGAYVVIKHDNGTQTLYAHASSIIVGVGQHVVQGQVIGYVGSTGRSTGAHLHFEIRGGPRNPF